MSFMLSERSKRNRDGIHPHLIEISDLAIKLTLVDFGHGSSAGLRTPEYQHQLFLDGKSQADGYTNLSEHQIKEDGYGHALDFYAYVNGATWEPKYLAMVAAAHLQAASLLGYKVEWGGLWKSRTSSFYGWDMPHITLI